MVGATLVTSAGISTSLPPESLTIRIPDAEDAAAESEDVGCWVAGEQDAIRATVTRLPVSEVNSFFIAGFLLLREMGMGAMSSMGWTQ